MVISFGQNSDSNYLELRPLRGVLEERYFGNLRYFVKYVLELSYRNKDKITAKYLKRSHFKNVEIKTKN